MLAQSASGHSSRKAVSTGATATVTAWIKAIRIDISLLSNGAGEATQIRKIPVEPGNFVDFASPTEIFFSVTSMLTGNFPCAPIGNCFSLTGNFAGVNGKPNPRTGNE